MIQKIAWVFAVVFILVGIGGYIPGLTSNGHLLGIFEVNSLHNIIHLLSGIAAGIAAAHSAKASKLYFQVFGVVYALVTVIGFVQGTTVLGLIGVNLADNLLHLVIAGAALKLGFCNCKGCTVAPGEGAASAAPEAHGHEGHEHHVHSEGESQQ